MTIFAIRPDALLDARRVLLRRADALAGMRLEPPSTGATSALTRDVFEQAAATVQAATADLRALGAGLAAVVELAELADEDVGALLARLGGAGSR